MPELRKDPLSDRWVIIAPERSLRPRELAARPEPRPTAFCPFCPGHESATGRPLATVPGPARGAPDAPWLVRAVPNRYPALRVEGSLEGFGDGVYDQLNGIGAHEVIIESPVHDASLARLPVSEVTAVLGVYRERILDLERDIRLKYILVFKNQGALAGATLEHPHSQLIALPLVPPVVEEELRGAKRHYDLRRRCVFCDIIRQELRERTRVVYESDGVVGFAPYASRFPFEVWLVPRAHESRFERAGDALIEDLAAALKDILSRLGAELDDPAYNFVIHTGPAALDSLPYYHWHVEITPILYRPSAGFELGSGNFINPTPPETAAQCLARAELSSMRTRTTPR